MNKKIIICSALLVFLFFTFLFLYVGCSIDSYSFRESEDQIEKIEIVEAEGSLDFSVISIRSLTEEEICDFLEEFQQLRFKNYFPVGEPTGVYGLAVKITYKSTSYELICPFATEYVKSNGDVYTGRKHCEKRDEFYDLLNRFLNMSGENTSHE